MDISLTPFFVLPIIAGFKFVNEWEVTRYKISREDGHRLYFKAAMSGFFICSVLYVCLWGLLEARFVGEYLSELIRSFGKTSDIGAEDLLLTTLLLSVPSGFVFPKAMNWFVDEDKYFREILENNELESVLVRALDQESMVMVSMGDGKVYVGFVYKTWDPSLGPKIYVDMIPVVSGYRSEGHRVVFTTFYENVYAFSDKVRDDFDFESFSITLPVADIKSIRLFDFDAYDQFQSESGHGVRQ